MFAAVAVVHILDHFFAAVVGDIDIDIRRLATFFGDEPFEQQFQFDRVNGGDSETVADRRVGRRASPLAENAVLATETGDIPHNQKISGQVQPVDHLEFMLELLDLFVVRRPPSIVGALAGQFSQVAERRLAIGDGKIRKHRFQLGERKVALLGNPDGVIYRFGKFGEQPPHLPFGFQISFGVRV